MKQISRITFTMGVLLASIIHGAWSQDIDFLFRTWNATDNTVTAEKRWCSGKKIDYSLTNDNRDIGIGDGYGSEYKYCYVDSRVEINMLHVVGEAHLILCDAAELVCTSVRVEGDNKISIYSQSDGGSQGRLTVKVKDRGVAGIGSKEDNASGQITIHGGKLNIEGGSLAAGIGGGYDAPRFGTINILGGRIYVATVSSRMAGGALGGGGRHSSSNTVPGDIYIHGGDITAESSYAAAIGSGCITGSFSGPKVNNTNIYITGGNITASSEWGAAIGSASGTHFYSKIEISGGTIHANTKYGDSSNVVGAAIGAGGYESKGGDMGGTITISGDDTKVYATTNKTGAGIGCGYGGNMTGTVNIKGGYVEARCLGNTNKMSGAGIGGGAEDNRGVGGEGGTVNITGGTVIAQGGIAASAIGHGYNDKVLGEVSLYDQAMVSAGSSEDNIERTFYVAEREPACKNYPFAKIEPCRHAGFTYTYENEDEHSKFCLYCNYSAKEKHDYVDGRCACGKEGVNPPVTHQITLHTLSNYTFTGSDFYSIEDFQVVEGEMFSLPDSQVPGLKLMGWTRGEGEGTPDPLLKDTDDDAALLAPSTTFCVGDDAHYFARYVYEARAMTWSWNDDYSQAMLTIAIGDEVKRLTSTDGEVDIRIIDTRPTEEASGFVAYEATATFVLAGRTYTFTDTKYIPFIYTITLVDDAENDVILWEEKGCKVASVVLSGRTWPADGSWNTLCLPFDLNAFEGTPLEGAMVKELASSDFDGSVLTLHFTEAFGIKAGRPYIVRFDSGEAITSPVFTDVVINNTLETATTTFADFVGSYNAMVLEGNDRSKLYLGANDKLYWPKNDVKMGACRAYFELKDIPADLLANGMAITFDIDGEGQATGILGHDTKCTGDNALYDITGRKMRSEGLQANQHPLRKGIYISRGRKIVIK